MDCCRGLCGSEDEAAQRSAQIDSFLRQEKSEAKKIERKQIRILLLGAAESGKSTLVKMKLKWDRPFSEEELMQYRPVIFANLVMSIQVVIEAFETLPDLSAPSEPDDADRIAFLLSLPHDLQRRDLLEPGVPEAIETLWSRPETKAAVSKSHLYQLNDSATYYFDHVARIGAPDYVPLQQDVIQSRVRTTGVSEHVFNVGAMDWVVVDVGGQRTERRKWIHCFEGVDALFFFVAINEYDQMMFEDETANRLAEAATLFSSISNSRFFTRTPIILFLNKIDLFKAKLKTSPLSATYPSYKGDAHFDSGCRFLRKQLLNLCKNRSPDLIVTHFTCAVSTSQISFVLDAVRDAILKKSLSLVGIF